MGLRHSCVSTCIRVHTDCLTIECSDNHDRVYVHNNCLNCEYSNNLNCDQVINKPCMRGARYVRLIPWTLWSGSEQQRCDNWDTIMTVKKIVIVVIITVPDEDDRDC